MSDEASEAFKKLQDARTETSNEMIEKHAKPFVVFMTPSIDHMVTLGFLKSYVETTILLANHGIGCCFQSFGGDPYLAKVRNLLVSTSLKNVPHGTDFFFLDADLEWDANAALRMVNRPEDIIAGIYPKKNDTLEFPAAICMDAKTRKPIYNDGLVKAEMIPTGFLRIKRHVYQALADTSPMYRDGTGGNAECWNIFEMGFDSTNIAETGYGQWWGEDFALCRRLLKSGYEIWVDPDIQFGHRGAKTWRNNFNLAVTALENGTATFNEEAPPEGGSSPALPSVQPAAADDRLTSSAAAQASDSLAAD